MSCFGDTRLYDRGGDDDDDRHDGGGGRGGDLNGAHGRNYAHGKTSDDARDVDVVVDASLAKGNPV